MTDETPAPRDDTTGERMTCPRCRSRNYACVVSPRHVHVCPDCGYDSRRDAT